MTSVFFTGVIVSSANIAIQKYYALNLLAGNTPLILLVAALF